LIPKWEININQNNLSIEQAQQKLKLFGSANATATLPKSQNLDVEKTYKLYIGGKQTRPDTQASRNIYLPNSNQVNCLVADASRKDVRNAVEAANSAFSRCLVNKILYL
jgi:hypothetical protein